MSKEKKVVVPTEEEVAKYSEPPREPQPVTGAPGEVEVFATPEQAHPQEEEWKEIALRARAELSNYQKRAEKDRAEALKYANASLVKALLPVIDNLERILQTGAEAGTPAQALIDGARLTLEQFHKVLRDFHVEPISAEGQPFDPQIHEAMMERSSEHAERTCLQEVARGYRLFDRVLRPSKVIVSKPDEPAAKE